MKKWMVLVISIVVALLILGIAKDLVIKTVVEYGARMVTGLSVRMSTLRVGIINTLVDIKSLRVLNPSGFKDENMLEMPEIYVAYDLPAIFSGKVHLKEARINMQEFTVVKNENGQLNLDSLKVVKAQKSGSKGEGKAPEIQIDELRLKIGKVLYKDYSRGGEPRVREFDVNIDEEYKNITNPYTLVSLIVVKALMNTTIASLANFDLKGLSGSISDTLAGAQKIAGETAKQAQAAVQEATSAANTAGETVSQTTNALSGALKNPFGGK